MANAVAIFAPAQRIYTIDANGQQAFGCTVEIYDATTLNPKTVYSDSALSAPIGVTVPTDAAGYPVTAPGGTTKTLVYVDSNPFKVLLKDAAGAVFGTHDSIPGAVIAVGGGGGAGITQAQADVRYIRNANALVLNTTIADADLMPFWEISSSGNKAITYANFKADALTDFRTAGNIFNVNDIVVFHMSTAPVGWTKQGGYNDRALRVVSGAITDGGTTGFSVAFPAQTPTGSISVTVGGTTLAIGDIPPHTHTFGRRDAVESGGSNGASLGAQAAANATTTTSSTGGGTSHTHSGSGTFAGNALAAFSPLYSDVIFAYKT